MEILDTLSKLMSVYEIASTVGIVLQIVLLILRKTDNFLLILGLLLDSISLSGMSCGHILSDQPLYAVMDIITVILDVAFILYILYREKHPKDKKK